MIDEAQQFEVSKEDKTILKSFGESREWATLKRVAESAILKWTSNLVVGQEVEVGLRARELERLSGYVYYWSKIKNVIEKNHE